MTTPNPVDLDALDALHREHECMRICLDGCKLDESLHDAYPALSAELRRLRGLVREYASVIDVLRGPDAVSTAAWKRWEDALRALYAAGKEIAK